ncbi:HAD-IA family hydrolase [Tepidimonas charontis]|uniref:phosphoglycolate phosphatase n=1 Tax=Tepidimonas charontis TaxID=2267262 RepID=A0A554WZF5_9BURK|nr:HAD-IA family hydrolase [Tepidimonas charontis]TSE28925.1 Phosphoglycolate phosphatase [Tepidimonas charontis]
MSPSRTSLPFDLWLFDLDGTLVETAPEIADAVNDTLAELGLAPVTQEAVRDWIGHGTRELLIQALAQRTGRAPDAVRADARFAAQEAVFARHYAARCGTRSHPYPHVVATLQALRAAGARLVVLTNKEGRYTDRVLDAHGLRPLFDRVISGDTLPVKKPEPLGVEDSLLRYGVARTRCVLVGDSSIDVQTARRARIAAWCVPYGYNMGRPIAEARPDRVVPDFSALLSGSSALLSVTGRPPLASASARAAADVEPPKGTVSAAVSACSANP